MNHQLGLRTLALLAFVAAATAMLVESDLLSAMHANNAPAFAAALALGHN